MANAIISGPKVGKTV